MAHHHVIACDVLEAEIRHFAAQVNHEFTYDFLEQMLHNEPERLRATVSEAVLRAPEGADAVLLGYGLCSNGLHGVRAGRAPLVAPRAHDCITLFLGSKDRYDRYFAENPGTYWYTSSWIATGTQPSQERYEKCRQEYVERYGEENADYLMEMTEGSWVKHYRNAAFVDSGVGNPTEAIAFTRRCAEYFGWTCDVLKGDPGLFLRLLAGEWNPEEFLVVGPGQMIVASHDGHVIAAAV